MKPCWFHPEAFAEADEAAAFDKEQQSNFEVRFLEALNDTISRIRRNPLIYRRIEGEVRKCRILRFPYGVIYCVSNERIEVIAVLHLRQRPGYWKSRT
ncbi:type II toxin-antitoxin system RelE/ParE family toxin [Nitrosococcus watsonii]|uniref:Plasmid stabilization system protein protein n=1 Tax=Nitrosococcus watsoni (strain C-113) TaxID=105559 RepID=D8K4Z4_NITWC|nr:type II toxin-antitoxin system RelE/ParE family toxin [Nitrosococcus watsonii]ADJ27051.1 plasmid stabilization system protein protein [Nitrosococcus watsonii C-113]ADJ27971.1 plasmid stabilization system protein protein [Nitrosococcus watsonii C-113]